MKMKCKIFLTLLMVIALAFAGCGFHRSTGNVSQTENSSQATANNQKHAASFADFRNALKSAGYLEINVLKTKYADAIAADGLSGQSLREAAKADGIIGTYVSYNKSYHQNIDRLLKRYSSDRYGVRQRTECEIYELELHGLDLQVLVENGIPTGGHVIFYLFDDEESATEFMIGENDPSIWEPGDLSISEDAGENYSKVMVTYSLEYDGLKTWFKACVSRVENTVLEVVCPADCPVYNIVDILGY